MILLSNVIKAPKTETSSFIVKQLLEESFPRAAVKREENFKPVDETFEDILEDARKKSDSIIQQAQNQLAEAEEYIRQQQEEWEIEKEKIAQEASQIGYQEGYGEGKRTAKQEYSVLLEKIQQTLSNTKRQEEMILSEMEPQLLEAGMRIANKILNQTFTEEPTRFIELVKRVIREVKEENDVKVYVHPSYYDVVFTQRDELKSLLHQESLLTIYPDDSIEDTQCIVESSFGRIEGGIDEQLQQIKQALSKRLEEG